MSNLSQIFPVATIRPAHASTHTSGADDVQTATASQKGLMSANSQARVDVLCGKNRIINPSGIIIQRGGAWTSTTTPANSDDTYLHDRWVLLSDGNDIVDVNYTAESASAKASMCFQVETASKKFGYLQIIEFQNCRGLLGGTASLQFKAKVTSAAAGRMDNIKAVVLSWTSTADSVTSDVVNAWNAEDTTPTWAAGWTAENVPANLGVTTDWATYKIENISLDSGNMVNVAVFIWCDAFDGTVDDWLYVTDVQLEVGAVCTAFEQRPYEDELILCLRYCHEFGPGSDGNCPLGPAQAYATTGAFLFVPLGIPMRVSPTSVVVSAVADWAISNAAASLLQATSIDLSRGNIHVAQLTFGVASGLVAGNAAAVMGNGTANARCRFEAEL